MNGIDWDVAFKGLNAAALVASAILNVYLWFKAKTDQRFQDMQDCHEELGDKLLAEVAERKATDHDQETRLQLLERGINSLPTHNDLANIYARLTDLVGRLERQDERSANTNDAVRRIERHLLDR